jgi:hypothetical protein
MEEVQNLDNLQIWTNKEMLSMFLAGIFIGFAIGIVL